MFSREQGCSAAANRDVDFDSLVQSEAREDDVPGGSLIAYVNRLLSLC